MDHFVKSNQPVFFLDVSPSCPTQPPLEFFLFEQDLVAPVTIIAASIWIFSSSFFSYCVQLSQTISAYSKIGRMNEK